MNSISGDLMTDHIARLGTYHSTHTINYNPVSTLGSTHIMIIDILLKDVGVCNLQQIEPHNFKFSPQNDYVDRTLYTSPWNYPSMPQCIYVHTYYVWRQ